MSPSLVTFLVVTRITFVWALLAIEKSSNVIANVPSGLWNRATVPFAVPSTAWNVPVLTGDTQRRTVLGPAATRTTAGRTIEHA